MAEEKPRVRAGFCPKCNTELVYPKGADVSDRSVAFWCHCPNLDCGWHGQEWYNLEFECFNDNDLNCWTAGDSVGEPDTGETK